MVLLMKPYQPSNKVPPGGIVSLALASTIGGAVIGGVAHLVSLLIYLILLFPLIMGFLGGMVMGAAARQGKVRNPAIAALFGLLCGAVIYGSMHGAGYLQFRHYVSKQIAKELDDASRAQASQIFDDFMAEETGSTGFLGYLKYSAQEGVSIGRFGNDGFNLGRVGSWIYWGIEFAAIELMVAAIAVGAARDPYCESCDQWYSDKQRLGSVQPETAENFLTLVQNDQFAQAGALLNLAPATTASSLSVQLQQCSSCKLSDSMLTVQAASVDNKGNLSFKEVTQGMISPREYGQFQTAIPQEPTEPESDPT